MPLISLIFLFAIKKLIQGITFKMINGTPLKVRKNKA